MVVHAVRGRWLFVAVIAACVAACEGPGPFEPEVIPPSTTLVGAPGFDTTLVLVETTVPQTEALAFTLIGPRGGRLQVGGHRIEVPRYAVQDYTLFIARTLEGNHVRLELVALRLRDWTVVSEFGRAIELKLSYKQVDLTGRDARRLRLVYLADDSTTGRLEPLLSRVHRFDGTVESGVRHFSQYAMAID